MSGRPYHIFYGPFRITINKSPLFSKGTEVTTHGTQTVVNAYGAPDASDAIGNFFSHNVGLLTQDLDLRGLWIQPKKEKNLFS